MASAERVERVRNESVAGVGVHEIGHECARRAGTELGVEVTDGFVGLGFVDFGDDDVGTVRSEL